MGKTLATAVIGWMVSASPAMSAVYGDFPPDPASPFGGSVEFREVRGRGRSFGGPTRGGEGLYFESQDRALECPVCAGRVVAGDDVSLEIHAPTAGQLELLGLGLEIEAILRSFDTVGFAEASYSGDLVVEILEVDDRPIEPIARP